MTRLSNAQRIYPCRQLQPQPGGPFPPTQPRTGELSARCYKKTLVDLAGTHTCSVRVTICFQYLYSFGLINKAVYCCKFHWQIINLHYSTFIINIVTVENRVTAQHRRQHWEYTETTKEIKTSKQGHHFQLLSQTDMR